MTALRTSDLVSLLVEVLPADGEAPGLVCAKRRMRQKYHCTNVQFEQVLCLAAAGGKTKRVFGGAMLARDVCTNVARADLSGDFRGPCRSLYCL